MGAQARSVNGLSRKELDAWMDFAQQVEKVEHALLGPGEDAYYRGHADRSYALAPSLFRGRRNVSEIRDIESSLFFEFQTQSSSLSSLSGWDLLQHMRHHGVPTRILDWTETLGVALYFAVAKVDPNVQPCIWVLNPYALNERSWKVRDLVSPKYLAYSHDDDAYYDFSDYLANGWEFEFDLPVAMYPVRMHPRMTAQRGYFTVHGDDLRTLDKQVGTRVVRRIDLNPDVVQASRKLLCRFGIMEHTVFPDADGLARHLASKYAPPSRAAMLAPGSERVEPSSPRRGAGRTHRK